MIEHILEHLDGEDALLLEPRDVYDSCLIGLGCRGNTSPLAVYDIAAILAVLEQDMDEEAAREHFQYNILGSWMGDGTPIFVELL